MGIFDRVKKEETKLEVFVKEVSDKEISEYVKKIIEGTLINPFCDDELLIEVLTRLFFINDENKKAFGTNTKEMVENLNVFYNSLAPLKSQTKEIEKIREIFFSTISNQGKDHYSCFDKDLYNLITDKDTYTKIIQYIYESGTLIKNIDKIKEYILNNREYFNSENFEPHMLKTLTLVKLRGEFSKDLQDELKSENQRRNAIYDLGPLALEKYNKLINGADSAIQTLKSQMDAAKIISSLIDQQKDQALAAFSDMISVLENKINGLVANANAGLSMAYNDYLQIEKSKLSNEKDEIIRNLIRAFEEKSGELKGLTGTINNATTLEIQRVRNEGNAILERLKSLMDNSPLLKEVIDNFKNNEEIIKSIKGIQALSENVDFEKMQQSLIEIKGVKGNIVLAPSEEVEEEISPVSYYMDGSKLFLERFEKLKRIKEQRMEKGEKYHEVFDDVLKFVIEGHTPYLWGPSGSGKTYMIKQISELLDIEFFDLGKINESYDVLGFLNTNAKYSRPLFFEAYTKGRLAVYDEFDQNGPSQQIILNNFIVGNGKYHFPYYGKAYKHPNFRILLAGNTCGNGGDSSYNGRYKLDESVQQRIMPIKLPYDNKVDRLILSAEYEDWFQFSQAFKSAITKLEKEDTEEFGKGTFTTKDASLIKTSLINKSFEPGQLIDYYFIQTKSPFYLRSISDIVCNAPITDKKAKELVKIFKTKVERICDNE